MFTVHARAEGDYRHATVQVKSDENRFTTNRDLIEVTWQANLDEPNRWYGGKVILKTDNLEHLKEATKVARGVLGIEGWRRNPLAVVRYLRKKKHAEVCFHGPMGEFYPIDQFPEGRTFLCRDASGRYCIVKLTAGDEDEARRLILLRLAERASKGEKQADELRSWLEREQPIEPVQTFGRPPDPRPAEQKLVVEEETDQAESTAEDAPVASGGGGGGGGTDGDGVANAGVATAAR